MKNKNLKGLEWLNTLELWSGKNFNPLEVPQNILSYLSNPQNDYPTIHIAGTNGKGSVTHFISSILHEDNLNNKIGTLCSPHIIKVEERAKIDLKNACSFKLSEALNEVKNICEKNFINPSYFVAITCATFLLFKWEQVTFAVIETGLGGRYDATNVLKNPELTIITSISHDHEAQLGKSYQSIAWNKGGIIKKNVPLIYGNLPLDAEKEIKKICSVNNAPILNVDDFQISNDYLNHICPPFWKKSYLEQNIKLSIAAVKTLGINNDQSIKEGVKNCVLPGRLQLINSNSTKGAPALIDSAHNPEGISALLEFIREIIKREQLDKVELTAGFLKRKNWMLSLDCLKEKSSNFQLPIEINWVSISDEFVSENELLSYYGEGKTNKNLLNILKSHSKKSEKHMMVYFGSIFILEPVLKFFPPPDN